MKKLLAGACAAATLHFSAFASNKPAEEPILFTKDNKTYLCRPIKPIENNTPADKGECIERVFQLQKRVGLWDFDFLRELNNILYLHEFSRQEYAIFSSHKIWVLYIDSEEDYEKDNKPRELDRPYIKRISEYVEKTCGPKKRNEKIVDVYVVSKNIVLATTTKNRIFKVERNDGKLSCMPSREAKKDGDNICVYNTEDGSLHFAFYTPDDSEKSEQP